VDEAAAPADQALGRSHADTPVEDIPARSEYVLRRSEVGELTVDAAQPLCAWLLNRLLLLTPLLALIRLRLLLLETGLLSMLTVSMLTVRRVAVLGRVALLRRSGGRWA